MKSESEKAAACAMFDAFCKEVLRNAMIDYLRKNKHINVHELTVAEPENYLGEMGRTEDHYSSDYLFIEFDGNAYSLDNDTLYKAMSSLPKHLLGGLLLKYWQNQKDIKIAKRFGVTTRTIRSWRAHAICEIQSWYEIHHIEASCHSSK
ncbi:hypothetical protein SDC9_172995 [bioreactor metagenome]|uniref:RNA polymerase sigma factor 70 region 4 type 2 domain-containing protein n=1 Tax=bioreactor metagenome TaxID=1076179 RepID=A0A645GPH0_9ZZZZ